MEKCGVGTALGVQSRGDSRMSGGEGSEPSGSRKRGSPSAGMCVTLSSPT